jgi:hypothetical protein
MNLLLQLFILQLISHFLTDFIFQNDAKANEKNENGFRSKYLKWHILITFIFSLALSFQFIFIFASFFIALTHWLVDGLKKYIRNHRKIGIYSFFIDQITHLIFILLIVYLFSSYIEIKPIVHVPVKYLLLILAYLICLKPTNYFIKAVVHAFNINTDSTGADDLPNAGKLIGIIERLLVLTFVIFNQFEAVGFLLAAKSILRFKNDNALKTEYVLIGTFLSFAVSIAIGIGINLL